MKNKHTRSVSLIDGHTEDDRMTDNEIIKALECCVVNCSCHECDYEPKEHTKGTVGCSIEIMKSALDLINRLEAENENLYVELKAMRGAANSFKAEAERLQSLDIQVEVSKKIEAEIKSEAIKELAKRAENISVHGNIDVDDFFDLVKEMKEVKDEQ